MKAREISVEDLKYRNFESDEVRQERRDQELLVRFYGMDRSTVEMLIELHDQTHHIPSAYSSVGPRIRKHMIAGGQFALSFVRKGVKDAMLKVLENRVGVGLTPDAQRDQALYTMRDLKAAMDRRDAE